MTSLKDTVNLPKTEFPIRAGLQTIEPNYLAEWGAQPSPQFDPKKPIFTLHDGPPYPNGNIHLGHAMNKVIKDIINRYKTMKGYTTRYIPGWDCHGLPIETQVLKKLKEEGQEEKKRDIPWFREECRKFALGYVDTQREDFKRLGIQAEWEAPYLTLTHDYEAGVISQLGKIADNGLLFKGEKPVHWCMHCETALAEAEIEYADHRSPSIYIGFKVYNAQPEGRIPTYFVVWTTTPWTLPSNMAVAAHPEFEYVCVESNGTCYIGAKSTQHKWTAEIGLDNPTEIWTKRGKNFEDWKLIHPLPDNGVPELRPVIFADFITQEDGTGFVHIAPGHGQDDYITWLKTFQAKPFQMPIDDKGRFTNQAFPWLKLEGKPIFEANKDIGQALEANKTLFNLKFIKHSYPHCWRCKNPVIFRATPQWFIRVEGPLREKALSEISQVHWFPDWGSTRLGTMVKNRPDWCISRQRSWGIPIPAFICKDCGHAEIGGEFNQKVVWRIAQSGSQAWFSDPIETFLPDNAICSQCKKSNFKKETDILDVWFESGASFASVLLNFEGQPKPHLNFPADLYLEGSDQHRGWFQSSLLIGVGAIGKAPYKSVLTHGFLIDEKGRKMSKSMGNVVSPDQIIKEFGADILRWWVASTDFKNDLPISQNILKQCQESFSKVRNTLRFCLSNLYDFDINTDEVPYEQLNPLDQWALLELNTLIETCQTHLEDYTFHWVTQAIHHFCAVTLSSMYLDMVKDRLYCCAPTDSDRRSTQTVLWILADTLIRLTAPILVFTSEDAYRYFKPRKSVSSVHMSNFPEVVPQWKNKGLSDRIQVALEIRESVYRALEPLRAQKEIKSFLEARVCLPDIFKTHALTQIWPDWVSFLLVSEVHFTGEALTVSKTTLPKCERCWRHVALAKENVCHRCDAALKEIKHE